MLGAWLTVSRYLFGEAVLYCTGDRIYVAIPYSENIHNIMVLRVLIYLVYVLLWSSCGTGLYKTIGLYESSIVVLIVQGY